MCAREHVCVSPLTLKPKACIPNRDGALLVILQGTSNVFAATGLGHLSLNIT